jgi:hypothetical protein
VGHLELPYKSSLCSCIGDFRAYSPRVINGYNLFPTKMQYTTQTCQKRIFVHKLSKINCCDIFRQSIFNAYDYAVSRYNNSKVDTCRCLRRLHTMSSRRNLNRKRPHPNPSSGIWMDDVVSCFHIHQRSRLNSKSLSTRKLNCAIVCTKHKSSFYFLQQSKRILAGT